MAAVKYAGRMDAEPRRSVESTGDRTVELAGHLPRYRLLWSRIATSHWRLRDIERFNRSSESSGARFAGRKWYGGCRSRSIARLSGRNSIAGCDLGHRPDSRRQLI